ncbi:MAG: glycosyltransferase family 9 protein [Phycisphaeraceae bacterium]|nr:glycosyltransferase family 9 protein [Phycisphaeraceae bacterium]
MAGSHPRQPLRLLVVCPSWLGDVVMATPALRRLRSALPGAFIGGLVRPGLDELLAGTDFFDEVHIARAQGIMGPKRVASQVRGRGYDTALLLTNSFSTALVTRLAFIPRRVGYDRDGRGMLLTDRLAPERSPRGGYVPVPMVEYYLRAAESVLGEKPEGAEAGRHRGMRLELAVTPEQDAAAERVLRAGDLDGSRPIAIINPGANNEAKRWPAERFAQVAAHLASRAMDIAINGSPAERDLAALVAAEARRLAPAANIAELPALGITIGALKGVVRRAAVVLTNDTGPRHIAAAFGVPTVTLFGPTDPRWTTLPRDGSPRADIAADPALSAGEVADDHPERCRIDRIEVARVIEAVEKVLKR